MAEQLSTPKRVRCMIYTITTPHDQFVFLNSVTARRVSSLLREKGIEHKTNHALDCTEDDVREII